jgi:hypothetical protein
VFGKKKEGLKEGDYVFSSKRDGDYKNFIFGAVTGVEGSKIGVNGLIVNPVGLKNKLSQGKAGIRAEEILENPTPDNCILALIYRIEHENFAEVLDLKSDRVVQIAPRVYTILDGWIRESLSDLFNNVLSLPAGDEKDKAKRLLNHKRDTLYDKNLKRNMYAVCRSLRILN